jgi:hypothetical protein
MYSDNRITKFLNRLKSFYQMEDEMRLSNITYAACALAFKFALATPIPAYAQVGAQPTYKHKAHVHHLMAIPRTATALVPAPATAVRAPETDGLSRNADDCARFGCIDH